MDMSKESHSDNSKMVKLTHQDGCSEKLQLLASQDTKNNDSIKSSCFSQANARSEKKRKREKMRRSEFNQALDLLASTLHTMDPESNIDRHNGQTLARYLTSDATVKIANRVDLINRTVTVLKQINEENEARKVLIAETTLKQSNALLQQNILCDLSNPLTRATNERNLLMRAAAAQHTRNDMMQNLRLVDDIGHDQASMMMLRERMRSSLNQNGRRAVPSNIRPPYRTLAHQSTVPTLHSLGLAGILSGSPNNLTDNIGQDVLRNLQVASGTRNQNISSLLLSGQRNTKGIPRENIASFLQDTKNITQLR